MKTLTNCITNNNGTVAANHGDQVRAVGFTPVPVAAVNYFDDFACDLYVLLDGQKVPTFYRKASTRPPVRQLMLLNGNATLSNGNSRPALYIKTSDEPRYRAQLDTCLEDILQCGDIPIADRFAVLQSTVPDRIKYAQQMLDADATIDESLSVGRQIARLLEGSGATVLELFSVMQHDFRTFTHDTNVSGFCVLLAEHLGITDLEELEAIAVGGLLHDLGKRLLPHKVLNKRGRLTQDETRLVRLHPQKGLEDVYTRPELDFGQKMMVYQHHERVDGSGYPVQILGSEIHDWARMCAVVDVFDALTCRRSYRRAVPISETLQYIESLAGTHLDKEMVNCWRSATTTR